MTTLTVYYKRWNSLSSSIKRLYPDGYDRLKREVKWKFCRNSRVGLSFDPIEFRPIGSFSTSSDQDSTDCSCWIVTPEIGGHCITTPPTDKIWTRCWIMTWHIHVHFYLTTGIWALNVTIYSWEKTGIMTRSIFKRFWPIYIYSLGVVTHEGVKIQQRDQNLTTKEGHNSRKNHWK